MLKYKFIIFISFIFLKFSIEAQSIRINEAMSSNSIFIDEDGDTPDWFELYNYGDDPISLNNWTISDKNDEPKKWTFPNISLESGQYILVWASDKDRSSTNTFRTLINRGDNFKYLVPNSEVSNNWNTLTFNDSNW